MTSDRECLHELYLDHMSGKFLPEMEKDWLELAHLSDHDIALIIVEIDMGGGYSGQAGSSGLSDEDYRLLNRLC